MNINYLVATAVSATLLYSAPSLADKTHGNRYMGANFSFLTAESNNVSDDASLSSIEGRIGGFFNDYVAAELRAGAGVVGDDISIGGTDIDVDLKYQYGGYFRAGAPVSDKIFPYVLLGFTRAELDYSGAGISNSDAETDTSFGVGIDVSIIDMSLNLEYARLLDKKGAEISGFSVGFVTNF